MREIEWRRLRNLTAREIINALARDGFTFYNQRGSHQRYRHADGRRVTVTYHRAGDLSDRDPSLHDRDAGKMERGGSPTLGLL